MSPSKTRHSFWLDGGYDFEDVRACPYHPTHKWVTLRLGDVLLDPRDPEERFTICQACYVPRCGYVGDRDRCTLWRHHRTEHVSESGVREPVGGFV